MYDAIIVGARCAGSPLAMHLARKGYQVLAVDRETFPADTISTSYMQTDAIMRIRKWGLYDRLVARDTPELTTMLAAFGPMEMENPTGPVPTLAPRRTVLDTLLVEAAREAGAEVRENTSVLEVLKDGSGAVTGVRLRTGDTESVEDARIVVGADGRNSVVAKAVDAPKYREHAGTTTGYYTFWSGFDRDKPMFYLRGGHLLFVFPTNDGAAYVGFESPMSSFDEIRADPLAFLHQLYAQHNPRAAERLKSGHRVDKFYGIPSRESFFRKPYGPGWALAGDAGYLKDPVLGDGINDAFWSADNLAEAIDDGFSGRKPLETALAEYEAAREAYSGDRYTLTTDFCDAFGKEMDMQLAGRLGMSNTARAMAAMAS